MRRRFFTLDVFTERRFAGNPLAVVLDCAGLATSDMQAMAREFNFSETVFVLPAENPSHLAKVRLFTPMSEVAFAGHPTLGTAVLLSCLAQRPERRLVLEEAIGPVTCRTEAISPDGGRAHFEVPRRPTESGNAAGFTQLAAALSLSPEDVGFAAFRPGCWSAGLPMTLVPLRSRKAVARARIDARHWDAIDPPSVVYLFCREPIDKRHDFHARMFAPRLGVAEDPATGSAVAALAGALARFGALTDQGHKFVVEQGYQMGRPSQIELWLSIQAGELAGATIGGHAVVVSEGTLQA